MYEFTEQENVIIKKLYKQMTFVGSTLIILGGLFVAILLAWVFGGSSPLKVIFSAVVAVVFITMGIITVMSANYFKKVVKTEGEDIQNLMTAIDKLTTWFSIVTITILIGIALVVLGFVASLSGA